MKNAELARMFSTMADIMEIQGENPFRVNSYRKVARVVGDLPEDIEKVAQEGGLGNLPGVGESSAKKIQEYLETGKMEAYEKLSGDFPKGALELLRIPEVGPKTVAKLMKEKGIQSIEQLEAAIEKGELRGMAGMGEKTIENLRKGIAFVKSAKGRILLGEALPIWIFMATEILGKLRDKVSLKEIEPAGSLRRRKETIGDIDILVTVKVPKGKSARAAKRASDDEEIPGGEEVVRAFTTLDNVAEILAAGVTKGSIRTREGLQVDLRVVAPESFGAALQYFTGSKEHNIKIRGIAQDMGLKVNEYGVFKGEKRIAGETEEEVYAALELPWIPPELREDRGEVEAAQKGKLPKLIEQSDLKGDLHAHTEYSDGALPVLEMAEAAKDMGYAYLALTDHSKNLTVANGLDEKRLAERNKEIDEANKKLAPFTILKGTEVDILGDGSIDYDDETLAGLDFVVASVHDRFNMSEKQMTERIVRAVRNPYVHAIGHLTGRLIGRRPAYQVDVPAVIKACAESGTFLELNAHPYRLDISDLVCREAKEAGVKVVLGTDAHSDAHYWLMQYGVFTARRGWLEKKDVINCLPLEKLRKVLKSSG